MPKSKKMLSEGLFASLLQALVAGKITRAVKQLMKEPKMKSAISDYLGAKEELRKAVDDYAEKYGTRYDLKSLK